MVAQGCALANLNSKIASTIGLGSIFRGTPAILPAQFTVLARTDADYGGEDFGGVQTNLCHRVVGKTRMATRRP